MPSHSRTQIYLRCLRQLYCPLNASCLQKLAGPEEPWHWRVVSKSVWLPLLNVPPGLDHELLQRLVVLVCISTLGTIDYTQVMGKQGQSPVPP